MLALLALMRSLGGMEWLRKTFLFVGLAAFDAWLFVEVLRKNKQLTWQLNVFQRSLVVKKICLLCYGAAYVLTLI